ncbi:MULTISPECIES: helix-turn-helix transcriptional regulator [Paenibacillus]|uniref:helix-turn-helix transcriptional regulator n=1 Tax=Paenibacillus TaxID=44249 RepID=UPI00041E6BD2|nr:MULTISPECIES: helix-turn-helix transcriptional regulator [Paenibacillus]APQ57678.1 DNA-binding protein [Paenibacillus polymyxa]KAF6561947.1 helix-turn-helix transcriptional regulator [Paenibacillus sp. EKM202P]KAF6566235.1 helix-turn-helix transcriptional regulator [Paenibacillus sp. EKM207P]UMY55326.1 helix-turn-helix domain-containing protein [Paenibacillus peoriae]WDZ64127.1 helix-turn-helix transcriptional regulator [Paenibacillus polymyxa]
MKNHALADARKKSGLTQEELAFKLGYSKATVSNWENGYSNPSLTDAFKISEILKADINYLFFGLKVQVQYTSQNKSTRTQKGAG